VAAADRKCAAAVGSRDRHRHRSRQRGCGQRIHFDLYASPVVVDPAGARLVFLRDLANPGSARIFDIPAATWSVVPLDGGGDLDFIQGMAWFDACWGQIVVKTNRASEVVTLAALSLRRARSSPRATTRSCGRPPASPAGVWSRPGPRHGFRSRGPCSTTGWVGGRRSRCSVSSSLPLAEPRQLIPHHPHHRLGIKRHPEPRRLGFARTRGPPFLRRLPAAGPSPAALSQSTD
jgi:hypothetical protein